jgi:phosphatidylinositol alpha-1,6-mannosyltransferase
MSVAFLSPCLCDGIYGGVQLSARIARSALDRLGRRCSGVYYRSGAGKGFDHSGCTGSRIIAAARAAGIRGDTSTILIWHIDMLKLLPFVRRNHSRTYLFLHGVECWRKLNQVSEALLRRVDVFLANSEFTWTRFLENNPQWHDCRYKIVPLGLGTVEPCIFRPQDIPAAVVIGRIDQAEAYKGHKELLRSWPGVRQRKPEAELWVVGGGDLEMELKTTVETLGIKDSVKFYGRVTDEMKLELIRRARCLLLPSRGEGFGLVYLEAMRQGRPSLVSTLDAGREVVMPPEAGLAVDPDDIPALSDSIVKLLSAGLEWDLLSSHAKRLYDSRFTASHFKERLLEALSD